MKAKFLLFGAALMAFSCGSGASNEGEQTKASSNEVAIDMDGPMIEANVLSFDEGSSKTEIELINRSDEPITSVRMRLVFINEEGDEITTATGRRKDSPFQTAQNPQVVGAKSRAVITARNSIEPGTGSIQITELQGTSKSGETITP
ncbi:MAG: hypothetical protein LAT54_10520 [Cryomorphaceae bacterium]|nr:hypothetical protein [Cryomorphaceae bacterium]